MLGLLLCLFDPSFDEHDFSPTEGRRTVRTYFHDLSSQAISLKGEIFCIDAHTLEQFTCLCEMFGTGYGYGVWRAKVTRASWLTNLSIYERINALDHISASITTTTQQPSQMDDAPELESKVIYSYNTLTCQLSMRYYYCFVKVDSTRGRVLLSDINHQLVSAYVGNEELIMEQSTFLFEDVLYCTLLYDNMSTTITCVNLFDDGSKRQFNVQEVRELINLHNRGSDSIDE